MSTIFFDGFDRGTLIKELDPNYWKTQFKNYPKYAFGAYTYDHASVLSQVYDETFVTYTPNSGILPKNAVHGPTPYSAGAGTEYPSHGKMPGYLALSNIPINQSAFNLTPLAYISLSGFSPISGTKSYFGIRCLGIETKDTDYHASDALIEGRLGNKHPFLAFCSGNTTGLLLNIVSVTGDNLLNLKQVGDSEQNYTGKKITIGLEVEQNGGVSGIFDLNIADVINRYRITPIYCGGEGAVYGYSDVHGIPVGHPHKILTIADSLTGGYNSAIVSRWTHFEFEIDRVEGTLRLKLEGVDSLSIDNNESDRELWDIYINISGFNYDNIRIYNRTYNSQARLNCDTQPPGNANSTFPYNDTFYYMRGALTLIDDVTLVDNAGNNPKYFLGKDCKVLPLAPGFGATNAAIFSDRANTVDGPIQWSKSANISNHALLASFDKDNSYISTADTDKITAITYSNSYYTPFSSKDTNSSWRYSYNDGIGGMKIYNYARKEFLDTSFQNVIARTGLPDYDINNSIFLIHANEINPVKDYSKYSHNLSFVGSVSLINSGKFDGALSFTGPDSFLVATDSPIDIGTNSFTIEAWIKFNNSNDKIMLFDRKYRPGLPSFQLDGQAVPGNARPAAINGYSISLNTGLLTIESWFEFCSTPAAMDLILPSAISTGTWNHIVLTRQNNNNIGYFTVFLNGVSGTGYYARNITEILVYNNEGFSSCPGTNSDSSLTGPILFSVGPDSFGVYYNYSIYGKHFGNLIAQYILPNTAPDYNGNMPKQAIPFTYFGGSGCIDELRVDIGSVRYTSNFIPLNSPYVGPVEKVIPFGPTHNLTRNNYKLFQYYQMNHPETSLPFTSGQIISSGIKLGVKKL